MTLISSYFCEIYLFLFINHVAESIQEIFYLVCLIYLLFILLILFIYFIYLFIYLLKTEEIHLIIDGYISVL